MAVTSPSYNQTSTRLEDIFGQGLSWTPLAGSSATAWETSAFHMQWTGNGESEVELRRLWEARKGHLRRIEQFIGNDVTHPICESALPTWLEWTQVDRPGVLELSVSIESRE